MNIDEVEKVLFFESDPLSIANFSTNNAMFLIHKSDFHQYLCQDYLFLGSYVLVGFHQFLTKKSTSIAFVPQNHHVRILSAQLMAIKPTIFSFLLKESLTHVVSKMQNLDVAFE